MTHQIEHGSAPVRGCPVADGGNPCHMCGGGWPGTRVTTEALSRAVSSGHIQPSRLGCGPLVDSATRAMEDRTVPVVVFVAPEIPAETLT